MNSSDLLIDAYLRIPDAVRRTLDGLSPPILNARLDAEANSISWLVWHLTRVQDDHLADAFGAEQVWTSHGWAERFALPFGDDATGYAQSSAEVAAVQPAGELLLGYLDAVTARSLEHLQGVTDAELDRVVDTAWDPPVTLGVRLISVVDDAAQHIGQAAFIRGVLERRGR